MSHSSSEFLAMRDLFTSASDAVNEPKNKEEKRSVPLTIRVTTDEKVHLKQLAGKRSISSYVRDALLGDTVVKTRKRKSKKPKQADMSMVEVARLLGMFGQSELATSMLALSLAVQQGQLELPPS
jgi:hypothetical protein